MCKNGKCNAIQHAFNVGRAARLKGQPLNTVLYPGMVALQGAWENGWREEDKALRTGDDLLDDDVNITSINVQEMRDNLDWAKEFAQ